MQTKNINKASFNIGRHQSIFSNLSSNQMIKRNSKSVINNKVDFSNKILKKSKNKKKVRFNEYFDFKKNNAENIKNMRKSIVLQKNKESRVSLKDILFNEQHLKDIQSKFDQIGKLIKFLF